MTLKIAPASPEEYAFAQAVNQRLVGTGASVSAFTMIDGDEPREYRLTFAAGGKRKTIAAFSPFHLDSPEDVIQQVRRWLAGVTQAERWTTNLEAADGDPQA